MLDIRMRSDNVTGPDAANATIHAPEQPRAPRERHEHATRSCCPPIEQLIRKAKNLFRPQTSGVTAGTTGESRIQLVDSAAAVGHGSRTGRSQSGPSTLLTSQTIARTARPSVAALVSEPAIDQIMRGLPELRKWVTMLEEHWSSNEPPLFSATDIHAVPFILAALNKSQPGLDLREISWSDIHTLLSSPGDGTLRGLCRNCDHYSAIEVTKVNGKSRVLNVDSVAMLEDPIDKSKTFRSMSRMNKLGRQFPSAELTWASTKGLNSGNECAICAIDHCLTMASQQDAVQAVLNARPGVTLPGSPPNLKVVEDGENHLPVEFFRQTQGKSHIENIDRFADILAHWNSPQTRVTREIEKWSPQGKVVKTLTYSGSVEQRRIELYKEAVAYCKQRLASSTSSSIPSSTCRRETAPPTRDSMCKRTTAKSGSCTQRSTHEGTGRPSR